MKKGIALLLAALMAAAVFAGCGSGGDSSGASAAPEPAASAGEAASSGDAAAEPAAESTGEADMRVMWWGSQARHDGTIAVIDLYMEKNPGIKLQYEFMGFDDYWQKLNTLIAANDAPDIIQMGNNFLTYEAQIEPLDAYVASGIIDTTNIADNFLAPTTINGKLQGISLGTNAHAMVYDPALFQQAGVAEPTENWTWEEFEQACFTIQEKLGIYGSSKMSDFWGGAIFVMQNGGDIFNEDGTDLGYTDESMMAGYFQMKKNLQDREGVYPTPDIIASIKDIQGDLIVTGEAATAWLSSNQLVAMAEAAGRELKMAPYPKITADSPSGMSVRSAQAFSVSSNSAHKEEAARFVNFFVNDLEANTILNGERGIPISSAVRDHLAANADDVNKAIFAYIDLVGEIGSHKQPIEPNGQIEIEDVSKRVNEEMAFGQITPEEAAARFFKEATEILEKNKA